jgi:hypothetical protein
MAWYTCLANDKISDCHAIEERVSYSAGTAICTFIPFRRSAQ